MPIRAFRPDDAPALAELSARCARVEADFVLNPHWESEEELFAEFARFGIDPAEHLCVADAGDGEVLGFAGFLRRPGAAEAGLCCPIVTRDARGKGIGGELLRAVQRLATRQLGIRLVTAGIATRNRAGYSLLTSLGFRPVRQHFLMRCDERPRVAAPPVEGLVFGAAGPEDAEAILRLHAVCGFEARSQDGMRAVLTDGRHAHAVARHGSRIAAFVELETHWPRRIWVAFVGVDPELRARGLGSSLVAFALARCFDAEAESALLMLSPANRTALRAYEKVGFRRYRVIDVLERVY